MSTDATEKPPASDRRTIRNEILIVLGLSYLTATAYALVQFAYITLHTAARSAVGVRTFPPHFDPFAFSNELISDLTELLPVALVLHLFTRAGDPWKRLGLVFKRRDVAVGFGIGMFGIAITVALANAGRALNLPIHEVFPVNTNASASYVVLFFVGAIVAAVGEEMIVNAYLLTRLEDLGWGPGVALGLSALIRGSYHLYQGAAASIAIAIGGLVLGRIFQRTKRIVTPLVAHLTFDAVGFLGYWLLGPHVHWLHA